LTVPVAILITPVMTIQREHMLTQCRDTHEITEQRFDRVLPGKPASTSGDYQNDGLMDG
jgi:hypothetical protein